MLEIIAGSNAQHQFLVEKVGVWIGSDERCDIHLQEPGISRFHAQIILDPGGDYWIEDAGSSFGTLLNGQDVEREKLRHNDVLTLGRIKLRFLEEEEDEILDGDALELIEESEYDLEEENHPRSVHDEADAGLRHPSAPTYDEMALATQSLWEEGNEPDQEGTALAPIPLSPDAFRRPVASSPAPVEEEEPEDEPTPDTEGTRLMRMPQAPDASPSQPPDPSQPIHVARGASHPTAASAPAPTRNEATVLQGLPQDQPGSGVQEPASYTVNHDEEEDLHGSAPAPRSRTVLFNLELERLKFQLQEREKQLQQLQVNASSQASDAEQKEWLQKTLEMVREDNQRLQYQISAYEEAAEENEELMKQVATLERANQSLQAENQALRERLAQYERYYYQQSGSYDGSTS